MTLSRDEYRQRWESAREGMDRRGLDAILVGDKYNYWYFTGHLSREFDKKMRPMLFLLPRSGDPALILYQQAEKAARRTCPVERFYTYEDVPFPPELISQALRESGLDAGRVGMELGVNERLGVPYADLRYLAADLPSLDLADAADLLQELRAVKTPGEIDLIRAACRLSLVAWERAVERFSLGATNADVKAIVATELSAAGSDFDIAGHVTVGNGVAGEGGYRPGEVIWCDFGGTYQGYQADLARRAVFAPVTAEHGAVHEAIHAVLEEEIAAIRPGVRACDVARVCSDALVARGFAALGPKKRVGHGLGLAPAEPPSLSLADETILRPGMVLTPEPRFFLPSGEKVHIEEVVVVTPDGCERLTDGAARLAVIG